MAFSPDFRPRCRSCGERWLPPEGVDAQATPCLACQARHIIRLACQQNLVLLSEQRRIIKWDLFSALGETFTPFFDGGGEP